MSIEKKVLGQRQNSGSVRWPETDFFFFFCLSDIYVILNMTILVFTLLSFSGPSFSRGWTKHPWHLDGHQCWWINNPKWSLQGVGEACSQLGALAFALDPFTQAREKTTCTGVAVYLKIPQGVKGVIPTPAYKIHFSPAKAKRHRLQDFIADENAMRPGGHNLKATKRIPPPTQEELANLFQTLYNNSVKLKNKAPSCVKVHPQFCKEYCNSVENCVDVPGVPASLRTLRDPKCVGMPLEELQPGGLSKCASVSECWWKRCSRTGYHCLFTFGPNFDPGVLQSDGAASSWTKAQGTGTYCCVGKNNCNEAESSKECFPRVMLRPKK